MSREPDVIGIACRAAMLASCTRRLLKNTSWPTNRASGRSRTKVAKAASISRLVLVVRTWTSNPMARAAGSKSLNVVSALVTLAGLTSTATRAALGTSSRRSSSRFAANSVLIKLIPVRLPPGRARAAPYAQISARQCAGLQIRPHSTLGRERFFKAGPRALVRIAAQYAANFRVLPHCNNNVLSPLNQRTCRIQPL